MEERGVAVGLEKKSGGRKKGLGFYTVQTHHRWLVTRAGGDDRRLVLPTSGDESVQYKTPTPSSSHQSSSPTRRPHLSLPLLRPDFAKILKKPCHS